MVFVKVRETYDLHTTKNKMTVIGIHTPKSDIIKKNYPGLLMQCRAYRPVSCDVRIACASMLPLDPQGIGTSPGDVAPEDVFNPLLYKAMSNKGMSQLEARIHSLAGYPSGADVSGPSAQVDVDSVTSQSDEFAIYYGLLSNTHDWKHAAPQSGLSMSGLKPYVYEMNYAFGDSQGSTGDGLSHQMGSPGVDANMVGVIPKCIIGKAKEFPYLNTTSYTYSNDGSGPGNTEAIAGFAGSGMPYNAEQDVPYLQVFVGCIIVPPSRLHELFYRMVVEWTIEFTALRPISEIQNWLGLASTGNATHFQNYSYTSTKEAITGTDDSILDNDSCMVSSTAEVNKVM